MTMKDQLAKVLKNGISAQSIEYKHQALCEALDTIAQAGDGVEKPVKGIVIEENSQAARQLRALQAIDALKAQPATPTDERVMAAVKNLRDLMKHGSANGAIEVWVQYDHPVKLAGLSHVDCENLIRAATTPKQDEIAERLKKLVKNVQDFSYQEFVDEVEQALAAYEKQIGRG